VDPGGDCDWGNNNYATPTVARNNSIRYNLIREYMKVLRDGGGIYTLGAQPNSEISGNYAHDQENVYAPLYLDQGTRYYTVENNIVASAPEWLHIWTDSIRNNVVRYNYTNISNMTNDGSNNVVSGNTVVKDGDWPVEARVIMADAGIEAAYQDIKR
jgi:hypothetical protein